MARRTNFRSSNIPAQRRQVKTYGTQTPLSSAAVERGSTRWLSGSRVEINGLLDVAGTTDISGSLHVSGTSTFSGSLTIAGPTGITGPLTVQGVTDITGQLNVTGPTQLDGKLDIGGDTTITGTLDIEGATTVAADLELTAGGKFIAGETTIEPDGKATFGDVIIDPNSIYMIQAPGGNMVSGESDSISLSSTNSGSVSMDSTRTELDYRGAAKTTLDGAKAELRFGASSVKARAGALDLEAAKTWVRGEMEVESTTRLSGQVFLGGLPVTTFAAVPNVHIDSSGRLYRTTWTPETQGTA